MTTLSENEQRYQQMLTANPKQARVWCALGETRLRLGKLAEAAAAYQNALKLEPAGAEGHFGLASVQKELGERKLAILSYRRGLATRPDQAEAILNLGVLLAEEGQEPRVVGGHLRGAGPGVGDPDGLLHLAQLGEKFGRLDIAHGDVGQRRARRARHSCTDLVGSVDGVRLPHTWRIVTWFLTFGRGHQGLGRNRERHLRKEAICAKSYAAPNASTKVSDERTSSQRHT